MVFCRMAWIYLLIAGCLEVGWPVGMKVSLVPQYRVIGLATAAVCMTASGLCYGSRKGRSRSGRPTLYGQASALSGHSRSVSSFIATQQRQRA
jgi:hypothetical protein